MLRRLRGLKHVRERVNRPRNKIEDGTNEETKEVVPKGYNENEYDVSTRNTQQEVMKKQHHHDEDAETNVRKGKNENGTNEETKEEVPVRNNQKENGVSRRNARQEVTKRQRHHEEDMETEAA